MKVICLIHVCNSFRPVESKLQRNSYNNFERIVKPSAFSEFFRISEIAIPIRILAVDVLRLSDK